MGCFSFICPVCGKGINSSSFNGENARLTLLNKGKVLEEMQGPYDSYGRVFDGKGESIEWEKGWGEVCDLMFESHDNSGISAIHVKCIPADYKPTIKSHDDPNQGWGRMKNIHLGKCEIYHNIY